MDAETLNVYIGLFIAAGWLASSPGQAEVFAKAGYSKLLAYIPVASLYVMLRITKQSLWLFPVFLFPFVEMAFPGLAEAFPTAFELLDRLFLPLYALVSAKLAGCLGVESRLKQFMMALGLAMLPFVFFNIIGFGKKYPYTKPE